MLSGELWPAHPHPYPGECLSSWIVRTAHHNGLKLQTFSDLVFGKNNQIWNRDIDRLAPGFVLQTMSNRASISLKEANKTTLKLYINRLFPALKPSGNIALDKSFSTPSSKTYRVWHAVLSLMFGSKIVNLIFD